MSYVVFTVRGVCKYVSIFMKGKVAKIEQYGVFTCNCFSYFTNMKVFF